MMEVWIILSHYRKLCKVGLSYYCYKQTEWRNIRSEKNRCESGTGKYIQYLDCDDVLMSNAIGCLVNRAEETQADVVVAPFFFVKMEEERNRTAWSLNKCPGLNI